MLNLVMFGLFRSEGFRTIMRCEHDEFYFQMHASKSLRVNDKSICSYDRRSSRHERFKISKNKTILGPLDISNSVVEAYLGIDAECRLTTNDSRTTNDDLKESS